MLKDTGLANGVLTGAGLTYAGVRDLVKQAVGPGQLGRGGRGRAQRDRDRPRCGAGEDGGDVRRRGAERAALGPAGAVHAPISKKVLELSLREALAHKHNYIGTEHLLLGLIREGEGLAARVIVDSGVQLSDLRAATEAAMSRAA